MTHPDSFAGIRERLIVALDVDTREEAETLILELEGVVSFFKVGYQIFLRTGLDFVADLLRRKKRVFLDLKMDDIPETIQLAVNVISEVGPDFLTLSGGGAIGQSGEAAKKGRGTRENPKILAVTLLSSLDPSNLQSLPSGKVQSVEEYVLDRARIALGAGCDGLIASGESVRKLREVFPKGKAVIVTPGIRPAGGSTQDHKRSLTPSEAILAGSDYIVVGRPIRDAKNRREAAEKIVAEMAGAAGSTLR